MREKSSARLGASGGAAAPPSIAPRIFFWSGQITNQTLIHMIVPSVTPKSIHIPRREIPPSASKRYPPTGQYRRAEGVQAKLNVNVALQRNPDRARRISRGLTLGLSSLSSAPWKGTFTKLKK